MSVALLLGLGFAGKVLATGDYLYTSPAVGSVNTGSSVSTSIMMGTSGDKICAVQGTVVFNNLICQSITLANGVIAQTSPTCSNPSFVLGIPDCTTANKALFTISSVAGKPGLASINFSNVNLVGTGTSVGSASLAANYAVNALPVVTAPEHNTIATKKITTYKQVAQAKTPKIVAKETSTTSTPQATKTGALALIGSAFTNPGVLWAIIVLLLVLDAVYFFGIRVSKGR